MSLLLLWWKLTPSQASTAPLQHKVAMLILVISDFISHKHMASE